MMEFIYSVLGVAKWILIIVAVLIGLLAYFQNNLLYMPSKCCVNLEVPDLPLSPSQNPLPYRNPSNINLNYEDVTIQSTDDIKLRGWLVFSA